MPALGTLVYHLQFIPEVRWHALMHWLAQQGWTLEPYTGEPPYALVDGTGIGYGGTFTVRWQRGAEVRSVPAHLKEVVVGYWQGGG